MKKRILSVFTTIAMLLTCMGVMPDVGLIKQKEASAAAYSNIGDFFDTAYDVARCSFYDGTDAEKYMQITGKKYYQGIRFASVDSVYLYSSDVTFNVEDLSTITFSLGRIDNTSQKSITLSIYKDGKKWHEVKQSATDLMKSYILDVSDATTLSFYAICQPAHYGLVNVALDGDYSAFTDGSYVTKTPVYTDPSKITCLHNYKKGVCNLCGTVCEHEYNNEGICNICGMNKNDVTEPVVTTVTTTTSKVTTVATTTTKTTTTKATTAKTTTSAATAPVPVSTTTTSKPSGDIAESGKCGDNLTWTLDSNGTLVISGTGDMYNYSDGDIESPFKNRDDIISVVVSDGVTSVSGWAFFNCQNLSSVEISASVISIGDVAFADCSALETITIPASVKLIDCMAFDNCLNLNNIAILNPDCEIDDSSMTINNYSDSDLNTAFDGVIYGYRNSTAMKYSRQYCKKFCFLDDESGEIGVVLIGDANDDGIVNIRDAAFIARNLAGSDNVAIFRWSMDFNCDGKVNVRDAASLAKYLATGFF